MAWLIGGTTVSKIADPVQRAAAIGSVRQTLLVAAAGAVGIVSLAFTARTYQLARRGQLSDRYTKAIGQLASDKVEERLGAIYALEALLRESSVDHNSVIWILAAFIRKEAPISETPSEEDDVSPKPLPTRENYGDRRHLREDLQAALNVIGRRPPRGEAFTVFLANTDLRGANLANLRFDNALFTGSNMQQSHMSGASLTNAIFHRADLRGVRFNGANLAGASLKLAKCGGMQLKNADIRGATLAQTSGLTQTELKGAISDAATKIPGNLL
ncbi:pentapeptide repeat-containing protein [Actinoplanes sp. HUAS TT8]|uniref:pentapeptide repeat-containing protein n=1 Tax=Actinoplanes sp. HUAS TT8 TaxID=3447453 RepID=UPI003F51E59B